MREFRPPLRASKVPLVLAALLWVVTLGVGALTATIALGSNEVTYTIRGGALTVASGSLLDGTRTVRVADVVESRALVVHGGRRVRGTGLPGLCTGVWSYAETGAVWQATDCSAYVVLVRASTEDRPMLLSPPDRDAFLDALRTGRDTSISLPPPDTTLLRVIPAVALVFLVVLSFVLTAVFVSGPKRMRYVLEGGTLSIETIFSRRTFDARELRARAHTPKLTLRVAGTAYPGYYTGIFRADGATTRVCATDVRGRGVLLEGPARVFVSPEHVDAFLDALAEAGASVTR